MMIPVLVTLIAVWKVFTKAGKPGWAIIIPIYGNIVLPEIAGQPDTTSVVFDPLRFISNYFRYNSPAKLQRRLTAIALLGPIFWCILGFAAPI